MNRRIILYSFLFTFIYFVKCEKLEGNSSRQSKKLPSLPFRRKVEEQNDADFFETTETENPNNLVSFLIKNVDEIFGDEINPREEKGKNISMKIKSPRLLSRTSITTTPRTPPSTVKMRPILDFLTAEDIMSSRNVASSTHKNHPLFQNLTLTNLLDVKQTSGNNEMNAGNEYSKLGKDLHFYAKDKKERDIPGTGNATGVEGDFTDPRRSCIMCNNIATEECNDPKHKLITSVMCERDDDLCYSLHTPFGIVDRGCFNINHNLTTYVCSCNLCNYITISEMPFVFARKTDWVDNVIELSRTEHFRYSVFKDMSCLKCEVNTTKRSGNMLDSANCLEGNIGVLPVEDCNYDEVCGVKALRADGYIWRGCMKSPLYNYWLSICDRDLCNYDNVVTLFDFLV